MTTLVKLLTLIEVGRFGQRNNFRKNKLRQLRLEKKENFDSVGQGDDLGQKK